MENSTQQLASDNYSGACPAALEALAKANTGYAESYGNDPWTQQACDRLRQVFDCDCEIFFIFTGTAANALALAQICEPFHSVIASDTAHIVTDECGAPGFFSGGSQILTSPHAGGKLPLAAIDYWVDKRSDIHYPKPRAVTLTQATECGTVYTVREVTSLGIAAHRRNLVLYMDGARFANAVAALGCSPADLSWRAGVDVLALGGTKNGGVLGDALLFFRKDLAEDFSYRCKQSGQLASKMRFISTQWLGMLDQETWLANARHANEMAARLASKLQKLPHVRLLFPVEANAVFAEIPVRAAKHLEANGWHFYSFIGAGGIRLMTSWNTLPETVDRFADDCAAALR